MALDRRKLLDNAQRLLKKGQIRKAISDYEKLVADDPRNVRIRSKLADLYVRNDNVDRAVEEYIQLAKQYETEDLNYRSISMYKKVLTLRPKRIDVHYSLADLYKREGLFGNAKVLYHNIIRLNPEEQRARRTIGEIDQAMVSTAPSTQGADRILSMDQSGDRRAGLEEPPKSDEVLEIDVPHSEEMTEDEEIIDLEEPLDLPIDNRQSAESNGQETGNSPSLTHQRVEVERHVSPEKDLESHYHLGIAYMEMELIDEAISEFKAALGYAPKKVDCLVMLGQCYMEKGVFDRSILYLEKASRLEGLTAQEYDRIKKELGKAYEATGREDKTGQAVKRPGSTGSNLANSNQ